MGQRFEKASKIFQSMFSLRNDMASYEEIENTITIPDTPDDDNTKNTENIKDTENTEKN